MLAGRLAKEQGADEALFVSPHGRVLEGPTWTFFWVEGGQLLTPPLRTASCLDHPRAAAAGVRRRGAHHDARRPRAAEEAFIASTVREVLPIAAIDGRELPHAPGPVTSAAQRASGSTSSTSWPRRRPSRR